MILRHFSRLMERNMRYALHFYVYILLTLVFYSLVIVLWSFLDKMRTENEQGQRLNLEQNQKITLPMNSGRRCLMIFSSE